MTLSSGARLGPYEVVGPIGAGGMGEVYKARDPRLDRMVAIKVLPSTSSQDPDRRARFDREARAIATLSHPNICPIYDVGHQDGVDFLVLEYLDGETLAARLARVSPLPLDETVRLATQIADALSAAHRAGVIHRDLKPGNVMVTRTGAKVLDFGLAKLSVVEQAPLVPTTEVETVPPLTSVGNVMGTLGYMSPEQIEGRPLDARSDLFAFGAMVYEMATGRRAFQGASQAAIMAAILERTPPPIAEGQPLTPPGFERLVQKCLAKDPDARWQSASDVADELRWLSSGSPAAPVTRVASRRSTQRAWGLIAAVVIAAAGAWLWESTRAPATSPSPSEPVHQQVTFSGKVVTASLSPDGRSVAYSAGDGTDYRVLVRDLSSGQELEVWKGTQVFDVKWLPDGSRIALAGRSPVQGMWLVSRLGGPARRLDVNGTYVAISPDGNRAASASSAMQGVDVAALAGGTPRRITGTGFRFLYGIDWTRTNRLLIPVAMENGEAAIVAGSPDEQVLHPLFKSAGYIDAMCASPVVDAFYVFMGTTLERVVFSEGTSQAPEVLLRGLPPAGASQIRTCSVSENGLRLLHVRRVNHANLWRLALDRAGHAPAPLTKGTSYYGRPQISNDSQWIVFSGGPLGEIAKLPLSGGQPIPLVSGATPVWSPDGRRLAFLSGTGSHPTVWVGDSEGRQAVEQPRTEASRNYLMSWLPDGRLAWQTVDVRNFQIRDLATGRDEFLIEDASVGWVSVPRFSPKGDTFAVHWNRAQRGLWTLSWPARTPRFLAADLIPDGWSPDGAWIYAHRLGTRSIVRVAAATGATEPVGEFPIGSLIGMDVCDVAPDGRALVCSLQETNADAWVIDYFDPRPRDGH